jgi:HEAT repeat protein
MNRILFASCCLLVVVACLHGGGGATPKKADVPKYLELFKNGKGQDKATAAKWLGRRGAINIKDVDEAIEPLRMALQNDPDIAVRRAAAEALGMIAPEPAAATVPLLTAALMSKDYPLRMAAVQALASFGPEARAAIPTLREVQKQSKDKKDVKTIADAIKTISNKAPK